MSRPLEGVRIVTVEHYGAGPFGTGHLAALGADVIKIENPHVGGDSSRSVTPHLLGEHDSQFFQTLNQSKRSLTLDLKQPEGQEILRRLAEKADGVMNNLRGDQPAKLKITYQDLKAVNPAIVCAHLSAYGREGSRATWPGYDYLMQAETGFMTITGEPDGPPTRMGLSIVDWMTGTTTVLALISAILKARATGEGCDIDCTLFDTALYQTTYPATWYLNEKEITPRLPRSAHPSLVPSQLYTARDGWIFLMGLTPKFWKIICEKTGRMDLFDHPDFVDFPARKKNAAKLNPILDAVFMEKSVQAWVDIFAGLVPIGPVYDLADALETDFVKEREMIHTYDHPQKGKFRVVANPIKIDGQRLPTTYAPDLGENTDEILRDIGYADGDIANLRDKGIV
jgi:succinate---hydroxymethylglutarate CoA-transferase